MDKIEKYPQFSGSLFNRVNIKNKMMEETKNIEKKPTQLPTRLKLIVFLVINGLKIFL